MAVKTKAPAMGVIVGTRGFFNEKLAQSGRTKLLALLKQKGIKAIILPQSATPTGAVETLEDARKCAALFNEHREEIDGVVVSLPNFGDELGIVNALHTAKLGVPVLMHAEDDDNDKVSVAQRRDAFCGKLSVTSNFYQYNIPWTDTTTHTCKVDSKEFAADLDRFVQVCRVVRGLKRARIGSIGARPAAFQTVRCSEKLLQASGITVVPVDLSEIIGAAGRIGDTAASVKAMIKDIRNYGRIPRQIKDAAVLRQAKLSVAIGDWIAANDIDAAAVQCWTSVQQNYGCATCLTMSMLGNQLVPCACEVDVAGAVSMYALTLASGNASALLDWNNNFGTDRNMCVCTHCSNYPKDFMGRDVEISELDILGNSLGHENCFGAIKGKVKKGPMTFFRVSTDDVSGRVKAYLGEGEFTDDPYPMDGGIAVCRVDDLQDLMKFMCKNGFEHHVGMARGHVAGIIDEAVESYLGWDLYNHTA